MMLKSNTCKVIRFHLQEGQKADVQIKRKTKKYSFQMKYLNLTLYLPVSIICYYIVVATMCVIQFIFYVKEILRYMTMARIS